MTALADFLASALSGALGDLGARGVTSLFTRRPSAYVPDREPSDFYALPSASEGNGEAFLTPTQLDEIAALLSSQEATALVAAYALAYVSDGNKWNKAGSFKAIEKAFCDLTSYWCTARGLVWSDLGADIWSQVVAHTKSMLPKKSQIARLTDSELNYVRSFLAAPPELSGKEKPVPLFVRSLISIISHPDRLEVARNALSDIDTTLKDSFAELRLQHAQDDDLRFSSSDLYVERTLYKRGSDEQLPTAELVQTLGHRPRYVIIGDPGVGKSTLIGHLIRAKLPADSELFSALLLRCRDYAANQTQSSIIDAISSWLWTEHNLSISPETLIDLLTLGKVFVIFDGVDEILDIGKRRDFIDKVESFSRRFPLVGVIATSRKVGYSKASFKENMFDLLELDEFSDDQVVEYAHKWFSLPGKSHVDADSFLLDSATVDDIRTNPLMLSLLCILYRMRGFIPQNRRHVYRECAELLFNRWDSMRHIEQPFDHRHYGQRLVQELALFYFRSQSAQAGVEEKQLRRIIGNFFKDTSDADPEEAEGRAQDFLDFCAGRAWLLTKKGSSDRSGRIFGFTHRTFMEYFAAEALVRRASDVDSIASEVVRAYESDPGSVLADVIVQCFEEKQDRGAEQIVYRILHDANGRPTSAERYLILALRIINACPVNGRLVDDILRRVLASWSEPSSKITATAAAALFELYRDPRAHLSRLLLEERTEDDYELNLGFCRAWARYQHTEYAYLYTSDWIPVALDALQHVSAKVDPGDRALCNYMVSEGYADARRISKHLGSAYELLVYYVDDRKMPGAILSAALRIMGGNEREADRSIVEFFESYLNSEVRIPTTIMAGMEAALGEAGEHWAEGKLAMDQAQDSRALTHILLWMCCAILEIGYPAVHPFIESVNYAIGRDRFIPFFVSHIRKHGIQDVDLPNLQTGEREVLAPTPQAAVRRLADAYPRWVRRWVNGRRLTDIDNTDPNSSEE